MARQDLIDVCYNGEQAVQLIERAIEENEVDRYSLILTDMSMPFMDGYEATKKIRSLISSERRQRNQNDGSQQSLSILGVTGHVEPSYIQKAKDSGVNEVFAKPMSAATLGGILLRHGFISQIPASMVQESDSE